MKSAPKKEDITTKALNVWKDIKALELNKKIERIRRSDAERWAKENSGKYLIRLNHDGQPTMTYYANGKCHHVAATHFSNINGAMCSSSDFRPMSEHVFMDAKVVAESKSNSMKAVVAALPTQVRLRYALYIALQRDISDTEAIKVKTELALKDDANKDNIYLRVSSRNPDQITCHLKDSEGKIARQSIFAKSNEDIIAAIQETVLTEWHGRHGKKSAVDWEKCFLMLPDGPKSIAIFLPLKDIEDMAKIRMPLTEFLLQSPDTKMNVLSLDDKNAPIMISDNEMKCLRTLKSYEDLQPGQCFLRCHDGTNTRHIEYVNEHQEFVESGISFDSNNVESTKHALETFKQKIAEMSGTLKRPVKAVPLSDEQVKDCLKEAQEAQPLKPSM